MSPAPRKMCVACDTAAFRLGSDGQLEIALVQRANEPFKGWWALPGGFVDPDEDLPDAAARELCEETGLRVVAMHQVGAWGAPDRDPRGRTVGIVYAAVARPGADQVEGGDDAAAAAWHPAARIGRMAFDHAEIVPAAVEHLRRTCERTHTAFAFLDDAFCAGDVVRLLAALGSRDPREDAPRLVGVAELETTDDARYRLKTSDYLAPLSEPVALFATA